MPLFEGGNIIGRNNPIEIGVSDIKCPEKHLKLDLKDDKIKISVVSNQYPTTVSLIDYTMDKDRNKIEKVTDLVLNVI